MEGSKARDDCFRIDMRFTAVGVERSHIDGPFDAEAELVESLGSERSASCDVGRFDEVIRESVPGSPKP